MSSTARRLWSAVPILIAAIDLGGTSALSIALRMHDSIVWKIASGSCSAQPGLCDKKRRRIDLSVYSWIAFSRQDAGLYTCCA